MTTDDHRVDSEMSTVAELFDSDYYAAAYPTVAAGVDDLLRHFCTSGWRELRKPYATFDTWWYWLTHLDPATEQINPLVHYAQTGRSQGLPTQPPSVLPRPSSALVNDRPVRRACLFAGFDADGTVSEAVLIYVRELARFSDVFVLFDNYLPAVELERLRAVASEAWAIRHGEYDFGSYSMLARDLVGWDRLASYDEVMFVNDSCYLLRPLDDVFARMDAEPCAWWGMQATKGIAMTRDAPTNQFQKPIPLDILRERMLAGYENDPVYDFLIASYFLVFRRPVLDDPAFRKLVDSVTAQESKLLVIQKYEIGLTHLLIGRGHKFSTFIPALYPFHPVFTNWAFELVERGFPLLKKYFLYQNHYDTPGLAEWRDRIASLVPDAPLDTFEADLLRTAPADRLHRSFSITQDGDGTVVVPELLTRVEFIQADTAMPKRPDLWVFAVDDSSHLMPENSRAVFDRVAWNPSLTKVILTRSRRILLPGINVVCTPLLSPEGQEHLLGAAVVFVTDRPTQTLRAPLRHGLRQVVAVRGHGLSLLKVGRTATRSEHPGYVPTAADRPLRMLRKPPKQDLTAVLTASDIDHVAETTAQWPVRYSDGWRTGLPAHDHLLADVLPADLAEQELRLSKELNGRRLVLFMPLSRRLIKESKSYSFRQSEVRDLASWARRNDAVIGIREPFGDLQRPYSTAFSNHALDISTTRYPSTATVLRSTALMLTDYEGSALDFTLTGRPTVSFAPDLELVADRLLFSLDHLFPGPVCSDFGELREALDRNIDATALGDRRYERVRDLMIDHRDGRNGARVVDRVNELLNTTR